MNNTRVNMHCLAAGVQCWAAARAVFRQTLGRLAAVAAVINLTRSTQSEL